MRTQADRDEDLALGRELERKDAQIDRLRWLLWIAVLDFEADNGVILTNPKHWTVQAKAALGNQQGRNTEKPE